MISVRRSGQTPDPSDGAHEVRRKRSPRRTTTTVGVIIVVVAGFISFLVWQNESFGSTDGGHVAIVRNGGPFDNTKIRQVLPASSGRTNIGMYSTLHNYPTSQRFFTISSSGNGDSDDVVTVPTADGVNVGVEGTAYFTLNTDATQDYSVLKQFDNKYGTRSFRCTTGGGSKHAYDGDDGFSCFLDQIVSPVINNDLRVQIGDLKCYQLVASCALVQNTTAASSGTNVDPNQIGKGNVNLGKIESEISSSLADDLNQTLGGKYFEGVRFNLAKIDLPKSVQAAIDTAQSSFASVTQSQADLKKAEIEAQTNEQRQKGYNACKACQQIDILKALPSKLTTLVLGNSSGVSLNVPAK